MNKNQFETFRGVVNQFDINLQFFLKESSISRILEEAMIFTSNIIEKEYENILEIKIVNENKNIVIEPFSSINVITEFQENEDNKIQILHNLYIDGTSLNNNSNLIISKIFIVSIKDKGHILYKTINQKNDIFSAYKGIVKKSECDQMSHMNVQFYFDKHSSAIKNLFNKISSICKKEILFKIEKERCIFSKEVHLNSSLEVVLSLKKINKNELILLSKIFCLDNQNVSAYFETKITFETFNNLQNVIKEIFTTEKFTFLNELNFEELRDLTDLRPAKKTAKNAFVSCKKAVNTWDLDYDNMGSSQFKISCVSDSATHFFTACGADYNWRTKYKIGSAALDYSVRYFRSAPLGMAISIHSSFTKIGNKSIKFTHHMIDDASGDIIMDIEIVAVLFDLEKRLSIVIPEKFKNKANAFLV
ncbi:MAG: thioesterase family protein [Proteobacteria bacterium]|nr:thioesterase family protein [Pseudomonadota bacterium]